MYEIVDAKKKLENSNHVFRLYLAKLSATCILNATKAPQKAIMGISIHPPPVKTFQQNHWALHFKLHQKQYKKNE
jgi:hypothetical protein